MGFCAQFGSYTLMDLNTKKILDMQAVSVSRPIIFLYTAVTQFSLAIFAHSFTFALLLSFELPMIYSVADNNSLLLAVMKPPSPA